MGTGDPTIPVDACEAKEIRRLIVEKSEGVTGSEDEPFAADDGEEYNEEEERVNGAVEEAVGEAANDNAVVGGVAHWHGEEGVAHAGCWRLHWWCCRRYMWKCIICVTSSRTECNSMIVFVFSFRMTNNKFSNIIF
jgi:hypothetical protein